MLLAIASFAVLGPQNAAIRKELSSDYSLFAKAFQSKDIRRMGDLLTDDYVVIQGGRVQRKRQVLAGFQSMMAMSKNATWPRKITALRVSGKTVEATVDGAFRGAIKGPGGKTQSMEFLATTKDTWVGTPRGYRLRKSVVLKNVIKIDGKRAPLGR